MGAPPLEVLFRNYAEAQDEGAARELVARTRPRLLAIARRIGNPADAEDSVQTAYLSLLHKGADLEAPVIAWLVTATVRIAYRAKARRQRLEAIAQTLVHPPAQKSPAALAGEADELRVLRQRVADLPASLRDPAVLHYFHGLSTDAVGTLLDLSRDAVKKRLQRARSVLRSRWGPRFAPLLFALPWWGADAAAAMAGVVGGLAMKKAAWAVAILVALAATTAGVVWQGRAGGVSEQVGHATAERDIAPSAAMAEPAESASGGAPGAEADGEYSGTVFFPDGRPAAGADVLIGAYIWKTGQRMAVSDPRLVTATKADRDGRFLLKPNYEKDITAIEYMARADGFAWSPAQCPVGAKARLVLVLGGVLEVELRAKNGGAVELAFWHVDRRAKAGGFTVNQVSPGFEGFLCSTAAQARFDLPPGEYEVRAQAKDLVPSRRTLVTIAAGETVRRVVELANGVAYDVEVVDPEGNAVEGALVEVSGPGRCYTEAKTDRLGHCRVAGIGIPHLMGVNAYERARFEIKAKGFAPCNRAVQVPDSEGEESIRFELRRGARVVFRFRGADGNPLVKQPVYILYTCSDRGVMSSNQSHWPTTDDRGEVVFPALLKGTAQVQVRGIEKGLRKVEITGEPQEILIDLAQGDQQLVGQVYLPGGELLTTGEVAFLPAGKEAEKDLGNQDRTPVADGRFRLEGLLAGEGNLWVWAPGFEAQTQAVSVPATDVTVRLRELQGVAGIVVKRDGTPVPGLVVQLQRSLHGHWGEVGKVTSDASGRFVFRGVGDGPKLHVRVGARSRGGDVGDWIESYGLGQTVQPGDMDVRLVVKPKAEGWGLRIPLKMRDGAGKPLAGRVQLGYRRDGRRGPWHLGSPKPTGTPGLFELEYYDRPGVCDFTFSMAGYLPVEKKGVVVADKHEQPVLDLVFRRGAVLEVVARYADGSLVAGETLSCGGVAARTDASGRVVFGGFAPGERRIEIWKSNERYMGAGSLEVDLPARVEVTLAMRGGVLSRSPAKGRAHWKLVDGSGVVRDEQVVETTWARLYSDVAGPHKVIVRQGETVATHDVIVTLGKTVSIGEK